MTTEQDDDGVKVLADLLRTGDADDRITAAKALGKRGYAGLRALSDALADSNTNVAVQAATTLGELGTVASDDLLRVAIDSPQEWVRLAAAIGYAAVGDNRAYPILVQALESTDADQHPPAIFALGTLASEEAAATLRQLATSEREPTSVREYATLALGSVGDPTSRSTLETLCVSSERRVRHAALRALVR